jgi:hypothetical protein
MKTTYLLLILMTLFACKQKDDSEGETLNGNWKLIKYHNLTAGTSETEPSDISQSVVISFSDKDNIGKITGHTVENIVYGDYEILKGNKMRTISFGGTKMMEPNWGSSFWHAMNTATSYKRDSTRLFIYFNSDNEKMEFEIQ